MDVVGQVHIEFSYRDTNMIWIDTERRMNALGRFLQSLAISAFKWDCLKQNNHHQIETPNFIGLTKTVNSTHLSFLVGIGNDAVRRGHVSRLNALYETVPVVLRNVLSQFRQQAHCPLLANLDCLTL